MNYFFLSFKTEDFTGLSEGFFFPPVVRVRLERFSPEEEEEWKDGQGSAGLSKLHQSEEESKAINAQAAGGGEY